MLCPDQLAIAVKNHLVWAGMDHVCARQNYHCRRTGWQHVACPPEDGLQGVLLVWGHRCTCCDSSLTSQLLTPTLSISELNTIEAL